MIIIIITITITNPTAPHAHQQTNRGLLHNQHTLSVQLSFIFSTSHRHLRASSNFVYCLSFIATTRCNPEYPRLRRECEWQERTERTQWRSTDGACSSTTSPAYPPRCGPTHVTANCLCTDTLRLLAAHHGRTPIPCYHRSLVW